MVASVCGLLPAYRKIDTSYIFLMMTKVDMISKAMQWPIGWNIETAKMTGLDVFSLCCVLVCVQPYTTVSRGLPTCYVMLIKLRPLWTLATLLSHFNQITQLHVLVYIHSPPCIDVQFPGWPTQSTHTTGRSKEGTCCVRVVLFVGNKSVLMMSALLHTRVLISSWSLKVQSQLSTRESSHLTR